MHRWRQILGAVVLLFLVSVLATKASLFIPNTIHDNAELVDMRYGWPLPFIFQDSSRFQLGGDGPPLPYPRALLSPWEIPTTFSVLPFGGNMILWGLFFGALWLGYFSVMAFFALLDITFGFISYGQQRDLVMAGSVIVVPYIIGGVFLGSRSAINLKVILFSGLTATIGERTLILTLAYITLLGFRRVQPDGTVFYFEGAANLLTAIQTEAIGYFGWAYLFWGIPLSIAILWITAYFVQQRKPKGA